MLPLNLAYMLGFNVGLGWLYISKDTRNKKQKKVVFFFKAFPLFVISFCGTELCTTQKVPPL